ncbi:hypothetical protein JAAARDRAFT_142501 [Jaapia argillacea MUCL 33604]|uniref:RING-type E3 ubiquitin transferase n=1 Tax=Jaapia argillacea MUCL 33604 TaxID=933084 RepID=A0A067P8F2_9AGAM|nr:hypothetical protein JAAARDRAFT_142501 [Jaapia argillacea MUCL 33604]
MSSQVATQTQTRGGQRGRRPGRGRGGPRGGAGRGGPHGGFRAPNPTTAQPPKTEEPEPIQEAAVGAETDAQTAEAADEGPVCWICAEPVKYYSVSECNHRTCHVCALRLRALYKKLECTFCKEPQPSVIFTTSIDALFSSYGPDAIPYKDPKLSIFFETSEMKEETLLLLRFNCPDPQCDYLGTGWGDLKLHVREAHGKVMCDLCIRHKKVFAHEQSLYPPNLLPAHLPSLPYRSRKLLPKEQIEGGIHPLCEFCRECFFSDDELYAHMRERHEECFICKRNEVRDQYFQNYDALERHFTHAHHPCTHSTCQARKFVVFGSALDLKAHMVEEHGADMSSRDKKDARRVVAEFEFEEVGGGGPGRRGRRDRGDREREREPPPHVPAPPPAAVGGPPRPNARRREGFGAHLTEGGSNGSSANITPEPSRRPSPSPPPADSDPEAAARQSAFTARIVAVAPNNARAVPAVRAAIRSYRASESAARDLISTIWNVLDRDLDNTASIVTAIVDLLLDEEEKKKDLLASWNGFKIEQRRNFPDLVPQGFGNEYAGIAAGRVLNAKHSTATRSSSRSSRQVWDRVAAAASASSSSSGPPPAPPPPSRFPPLNPAGPTPVPVPAYRQPQRNTPWASTVAATSSANTFRPMVQQPSRSKPSGGPARAPTLSQSAFPELPSASSGRAKPAVGGNQSLRKILGDPDPPASVWGGGDGTGTAKGGPVATNGGSQGDGSGNVEDEEVRNEMGSGKKKGKGKQKQTLFKLGSFPT